MEVRYCIVDLVQVGDRLRSLNPEKVSALAESMADIGLNQPISVWSDGMETLELVAGRHRLEAARKLGWEDIDCIFVDMDELDRQLWEIDENLMRSELSGLERAKHTAKRAEVVKQKAELKPDLDLNSDEPKKRGPKNKGQVKFVDDTAKATGRSKASVKKDKARGEKIADDVAETIYRMPDGDDIANSGAELDALARVSPEVQRQAVHLVECDKAGTIRQAIVQLKPPNPTPDINRVIRDLARGVNKILAEDDKKREALLELSGFFGEADLIDVRGLHVAFVELVERIQGFIKSINLEEHDGHGDVMEHQREDERLIEGDQP